MATVVTRATSLDGDGNGVCPFKAAKQGDMNEGLFSLGTIHKGRPHQGGRGVGPMADILRGGCVDLVL